MKISTIIERVKTAVLKAYTESPVELFVCCVFTILGLMSVDDRTCLDWLFYFPFYLSVAMVFNRVFASRRRWYVISSLLCGVLLLYPTLTFKPEGIPYVMSLIVSVMAVLLTRTRYTDNQSTSSSIVTSLTDAVLRIIICIATLLILAIILGSVTYLFDLDVDLAAYGWQWSLFLIGPMTFVSLCDIHNDRPIEAEKSKFIAGVAHYLVTPAIIIYTAILYAYTIKVLLSTTLPLGGVAWLIGAFYAASMIGYMAHIWSPFKAFDWYYKSYPWLSIPLLALFWWGVCYRIGAYSFTEARVYLLIGGTIMTLTTVVLATRNWRGLKLMGWIATVAIAVFTYVPGINAKSLGIVAQTQRLEHYMAKLDVVDDEGHFKEYDKNKIEGKDSEVKELQAAYEYLRQETDEKNVEEKYKPIDDESQDILQVKTADKLQLSAYEFVDCITPTSCEGYPYFHGEFFPKSGKEGEWVLVDEADTVKVTHEGVVVLNEPIKKTKVEQLIDVDPEEIVDARLKQETFAYSNDSVMVVVKKYLIEDGNEYSVNSGYIFTKNP